MPAGGAITTLRRRFAPPLASLLVLALALLLAPISAPAQEVTADSGNETRDADSASPVTVSVEFAGELIIVEGSMEVPATRKVVWDVLTDYDNAARYITALKNSKVVSKNGQTWVVAQDLVVRFGPFSLNVDSVRELQLSPYDWMRSHTLKGNMKRADGVTRVGIHSELVPNFWLPSFLTRHFIERQTLEQYMNVRNEILRRQAAVAQAPGSASF